MQVTIAGDTINLTEDKIRNMSAGSALDRLVAGLLFGREDLDDPPPYSESILLCWSLVEKYGIEITPPYRSSCWKASGWFGMAESNTAPLAICKCALSCWLRENEGNLGM